MQQLHPHLLLYHPLGDMYRIGTVADIYRPVDSQTFPKEFALVGFYNPAHVAAAIQCLRSEQFINNVHVVVEEAKPWMLDLYPKK